MNHMFPVTGHRMSRNRHGEPVCQITLVGQQTIYRFATRMLVHQSEFARMGQDILGSTPCPRYRRPRRTCDTFQRYQAIGIQDQVLEITLVGWHSIHRFAYNMLGWQVEFSAMGRKILRSHRRDAGRDRWRALWAMYHGEHDKPMTFTWKNEL